MFIGLVYSACMITSLLAIVSGLSRRTPHLFYIAAGSGLPTSLYLAAVPWLGLWPLTFPVLVGAGGIACKYRRVPLAILLVIPYVTSQFWLLSAVLSQEAGWIHASGYLHRPHTGLHLVSGDCLPVGEAQPGIHIHRTVAS